MDEGTASPLQVLRDLRVQVDQLKGIVELLNHRILVLEDMHMPEPTEDPDAPDPMEDPSEYEG